MNIRTAWFTSVLASLAVAASVDRVMAAPFLVKDGQVQAEIVIADKPPRMTKLAAQELQTYVEKITGARLLITTSPSKDVPVHIYVGKSEHTNRLKIDDE